MIETPPSPAEGARLPWDVVEIVRNLARKTDTLLDIGCGAAAKLQLFAPLVARAYGLDCNHGRLAEAAAGLRTWGATHIVLVEGLSQHLPFADETFDLVTCIAAPHDVRAIWRVLKPGGWAILEKVGERDKDNIKAEFGDDEHGPRGIFMGLEAGERARRLEAEFAELFVNVRVRSGQCRRVYRSMQEVIATLERCSLVRGFDRHKDATVLERLQAKIDRDGEIESRLHRILVQAQKAT